MAMLSALCKFGYWVGIKPMLFCDADCTFDRIPDFGVPWICVLHNRRKLEGIQAGAIGSYRLLVMLQHVLLKISSFLWIL